MELLYIDGAIVKPTPEALQLTPFKEIWDRDKSPKKEQALAEFTYIKLMLCPSKNNPYYGYRIEDRPKKICERMPHNIINDEDNLIVNAMDMYEEIMETASPTKRYYDDCVIGAEKQGQFLRDVNFSERDEKGAAVYKPGDTDRILKSSYETLASLTKMKEQVQQEVYESTKTKGNREINYFEKRNRK